MALVATVLAAASRPPTLTRREGEKRGASRREAGAAGTADHRTLGGLEMFGCKYFETGERFFRVYFVLRSSSLFAVF